MKRVDKKEAYNLLRNSDHVFLKEWWNEAVLEELSFLSTLFYLYKDNYLLRLVSDKKGQLKSLPFSDGGDVVSLDSSEIDIETFEKDMKKELGEIPDIRISDYFCPMSNQKDTNLIDYKISLEGNLKDDLRSTLRHVIEKGIDGEIEKLHDSRDLGEVYRLYIKTMRRVGNVALPKVVFEKILENKNNEIFIWRKDRVIHDFSVFLTEGDSVFYFINASDNLGREQNATHHILWRSLGFFKAEGKNRLFMGGTRKDSGLAVFKKGWGGVEIPVWESREDKGGGTGILKKMWSFIPLSFIPYMSRLALKNFL